MTYRIGYVSHAREVWTRSQTWGRAPKGFNHIGSGAYRAAYLHVDSSIVYKIGETDANDAEIEYSHRLRSKMRTAPVPVFIPRVRGFKGIGDEYTNIIAAEYFKGRQARCKGDDWYWVNGWELKYYDCHCKGQCPKEARKALEEWSGLADMHSGNVLWDGTRFAIIDMGEDWNL